MVKNILLLLPFMLTLTMASADQPREPMDGDSLRQMLRKSEQQHRQRDLELKYDQMHELYKVNRRSESNQDTAGQPDQTQEADKASNQAVGSIRMDALEKNVVEENSAGSSETDALARSHLQEENDQHDLTENESGKGSVSVKAQSGSTGPVEAGQGGKASALGREDRYVPASWKVLGGGGGFATDQAKVVGPTFGIRLGTRLTGEIRRVVTNVERNLCEVYLNRDVVGEKGVLPQGTTLFCQKALNPSTKRLEMMAVKGITPEGVEFTLQAYVMDLTEMAGLSARSPPTKKP